MYPAVKSLLINNSADPFYSEALRAYISQFDFLDVPLDVALRKLLMEVGLPRETQQIDRVMEAFAFRYTQCNPNVFISEGMSFPYLVTCKPDYFEKIIHIFWLSA